MPANIVPIEGIDKVGVIQDAPASTLPPGAWTDARNVRFDDGAIRRMKGQTPIFATHGLTNIQHIAYWENPNKRCYVVINRETGGDYVYLVSVGGSGTEVSTTPGGPYAFSENWTSAQFNGGYTFIINNGIDAPQHSTVQLGGASDINGQPAFAMLPGWDSYISGSYIAQFLTVSADILIPYGNLLVAGALTERSLPQIGGGVNPMVPATVNADGTLTVTFNTIPSIARDDRIEITGDPTYTWTYLAEGDGTLQVQNEVRSLAPVLSPYNREYTVTTFAGNTVTLTPTVPFDPTTAATTLELPSVMRTFDPDTNEETTVPPSPTQLPPFSGSGDIVVYWTYDDTTSEPPPTVIVRDLNGVVRTSDVAAPGNIPQSWNPFMTGANTADEIALADAGKISAIRELRGNLFVFTSDTITQLRVSTTGLTQVPITKEYGALTQNGVFGFQGSLVVIGSDDIYVFSGNPGDIKSIADSRVRLAFYDQLNAVTFRNMQIRRNQLHDEIWICFPSMTSATPDRLDTALIWDYTTNTWTYRDLPSPRSLAVGPVEGSSTGGEHLVIPTDGTSYSLTVTNANGQTTEQNSGTAVFDYNALLVAVNIDINGQAGLTSRIVADGLVVNDARLGSNGWVYELRIDGVLITPVPFTGGTSEAERPWSNTVLNEAKNFIVMAGTDSITAAELGYSIGSPAFLEKTQMRFAPSRDVEKLMAIYMETESAGSPIIFDVSVKTRGTTGGLARTTHEYTFNTVDDYKLDTHLTSRLIDIRIQEPDVVTGPWDIAAIELAIAVGGTR